MKVYDYDYTRLCEILTPEEHNVNPAIELPLGVLDLKIKWMNEEIERTLQTIDNNYRNNVDELLAKEANGENVNNGLDFLTSSEYLSQHTFLLEHLRGLFNQLNLKSRYEFMKRNIVNYIEPTF